MVKFLLYKQSFRNFSLFIFINLKIIQISELIVQKSEIHL